MSSHCSHGGVETELHFLTERTDWAHTAVGGGGGWRQSYTSSQRGQTELTLQSGRGGGWRQSYTSSQRGQTELTLQSGRGGGWRQSYTSSQRGQTELTLQSGRGGGWRQSYTSSQRGQTELTLQSGKGGDRATLPHNMWKLPGHKGQPKGQMKKSLEFESLHGHQKLPYLLGEHSRKWHHKRGLPQTEGQPVSLFE